MIYVVFGGTLNVAQLNSTQLNLPHLHLARAQRAVLSIMASLCKPIHGGPSSSTMFLALFPFSAPQLFRDHGAHVV